MAAAVRVPTEGLPLDTIIRGDCLDVLRSLPDASVDAIVTDPPYGLGEAPDMAAVLGAWLAGEAFVPRNRGGFMGKAWDAFVPGPEYWRAAYRVLKPGGHLLAFAGTRTEDVMGISIRLAGFDRRDTLYWIHGQGFPKSLDIGKQIDRMAGAERQVVGISADFALDGCKRDAKRHKSRPTNQVPGGDRWALPVTAPATDAAKQWDGWGTALKPAVEPIILARKPLSEGTVAANVLRWGVGALNVDACRVGDEQTRTTIKDLSQAHGNQWGKAGITYPAQGYKTNPPGRWPPHLLLSHSLFCTDAACAEGCPVRVLGEQSGTDKARPTAAGLTGYQRQKRHSGRKPEHVYGGFASAERTTTYAYDDAGTAARFFPQFRYVAKASRSERTHGGTVDNRHCTVKPLALCRWLITLITPPGGIVLDPFAGSGTTCLAAQQLGMHWLGIEQSAEYVAICRARLGMGAEEEAS